MVVNPTNLTQLSQPSMNAKKVVNIDKTSSLAQQTPAENSKPQKDDANQMTEGYQTTQFASFTK